MEEEEEEEEEKPPRRGEVPTTAAFFPGATPVVQRSNCFCRAMRRGSIRLR